MAVNKFSLRYTQLYAKLSQEEINIFLEWEAKIDEALSSSHPCYFQFMDFRVKEDIDSKILQLLKLAYHNNGWRIEFFYKQIPCAFIGYENGPLTSIRVS